MTAKILNAAVVRTLLVCLLGAVCLFSGCVHRRLTVRTTPADARIYIDDEEIGPSPASTNYIYYGTRRIRAERDGYETTTVQQTISPPWYQIPPLDFFSENLWPGELRDEREVQITLQPKQIKPIEQLRSDAEQLRTSANQGVVAPAAQGPAPYYQPPEVVPAPQPARP